MNQVRRIGLMLAVLGPLALWAQPKEPASSVFDDFPVPPPSKNLLFYIQRNKNANTIVYEARLDANGQLAAKDPVDPLHQRREERTDQPAGEQRCLRCSAPPHDQWRGLDEVRGQR
jgi:Domain of unknown function (DUF4833)